MINIQGKGYIEERREIKDIMLQVPLGTKYLIWNKIFETPLNLFEVKLACRLFTYPVSNPNKVGDFLH